MINQLHSENYDQETNKENITAKRCDGKEQKIVVSATLIVYKDCRKNHAANIGRYAVDGCCEFMAAGDAGSAGAFLCAACNCHRNFHRKVVIWSSQETSSSSDRSSMSATATTKQI